MDRRRFYEDPDGQVDGEGPLHEPFSYNPRSPTFMGNDPPWKLWGNTERKRLTTLAFGTAPQLETQLIRVNYARPDTWHWFFSAHIVAGPTPADPQIAGIRIAFDVTIGVGRAAFKIPNFEEYVWIWGDPGGGVSPLPPLLQPKWSNSVWGPQRQTQNLPSPAFPALPTAPNELRELVAQDIQVNFRMVSESNFPNSIEVEVFSFWAPKTHIRPDWLQPDAPDEAMFAGGEIGGK